MDLGAVARVQGREYVSAIALRVTSDAGIDASWKNALVRHRCALGQPPGHSRTTARGIAALPPAVYLCRMEQCCNADDLARLARHSDHRRVLAIVLAVNALLFVVEAYAGFIASSTALLADSLDMLGDSLVYGFSLYVVARSQRSRAHAAVLKGIIMIAFAVLVLGEAAHKVLNPVMPAADAMGLIGLVALAGNALCFWLLYRHRSDGINMRSTWLCSRNDLIANISVIAAAAAVARTGSAWPDIVVGLSVAALFVRSGMTVLHEAFQDLQAQSAQRA